MSEMAKLKRADVALPSGRSCGSCGSPADVNDKYCVECGSTLAPVDVTATRIPLPRASEQTTIGQKSPDEDNQQFDDAAQVKSQSQVANRRPLELKTFRCQNCSAEITVDPASRSYICPFCESTYVIELTNEANKQRPEFVVGFSVPPADAWEKFSAWTREGSLFRPLDLRQVVMPDKLRGVYLPFWSFSMLARADWAAQIGEYWYRTETYTVTVNGKTETRTRQVQETEWWPLNGRFQHYYYGYLVSGSTHLEQRYAEAIKPFHIAAVKRYEPFFLAGWLSEEYTIDREAALQQCQQEFTSAANRDIVQFLPGDTYRSLGAEVDFEYVNSDLILLPIYLLNYQYKGKSYRFVLNGQTGKIYGERPLSWLRIGLYAAGAILTGLAIGLAMQLFK